MEETDLHKQWESGKEEEVIDQLNIYGMTKLEVSIERIKQIEPRGAVGIWLSAVAKTHAL